MHCCIIRRKFYNTVLHIAVFLSHFSCTLYETKKIISSKTAENTKVLLGVYNISDKSEPCRKELEVETILLHGGWDPDSEIFAHDIAILKLKHKIDYNQVIFPICLTSSFDILKIKTGIVAGYGEFKWNYRIAF